MQNARGFVFWGIRIAYLLGLLFLIGHLAPTTRAANCGPAPLPACPSQSPVSSPTVAQSGSTNSDNDGPTIRLAGSPPASLTGPFMRSCANDIVLAWVAPDRVNAQLVVTGGDGKIVYDSRPPKNARNPLLYIWATEDVRATDPFFYQKIDIFEKGQIYTAKLTITDSKTVASSDQLLTATFDRKTATDGPCALTLTDFLASAGITYQAPTGESNTNNTSSSSATGNQTTSPKTTGSANQATRGNLDRTPLEAYLATIFNQPVLTLGDRVVRGASLIWWLFEILVLAATVLGIYFFIKRRRLWGIVYDGRSKDPIEMAVVRLFDQEHHKLLETRVTPKSGRYSFLAEPGAYYLDVTKEGYHFPSRIVTSTIDNEYSNLYRGEIIKLGVGQSLVAPDVPIDSEAGEIKTASFYRRRVFPWLDRLRLPILLLATFLAPVVYLGRQSGEITSSYLLPVGTMLIVIFLISEFLFVRRGRK